MRAVTRSAGYPLGGMLILPPSGGATVLTRDTAGFRPFLQETSLVHDQHAIGIAQRLGDEGEEIIAHGVGVPVGTVEQGNAAVTRR